MKTLRTVILTVVVTLVAVGGWGHLAPAGSAAAPTVYSRTIVGSDMHSLDPRLDGIFVEGGGLRAVAANEGAAYNYFEGAFDLPVGAKVTSIAVTYKYCDDVGQTAYYVFGSYNPATRGTLQNTTLNAVVKCTPGTVTKTGNPITTVAAGRRYVIDWSPTISGSYTLPNPSEIFYGATVKYTCTSPCVP